MPVVYVSNVENTKRAILCNTPVTTIDPGAAAGLSCQLEEAGFIQLGKDVGF
jgi:hypothetical protein